MITKYLIRMGKYIDKEKWYSGMSGKYHIVVESGIEGKFRPHGDEETDDLRLIDSIDVEIIREFET